MSNVFINIVFTWPTFGPRVVDTVKCPRSNFYSYLRHFNIDYFTFHFTSDIIMSNGVTVKRWTYDNAQRHVTAFRPISEAAHSWSYDNTFWSTGVRDGGRDKCPAFGGHPEAFHLSVSLSLGDAAVCR